MSQSRAGMYCYRARPPGPALQELRPSSPNLPAGVQARQLILRARREEPAAGPSPPADAFPGVYPAGTSGNSPGPQAAERQPNPGLATARLRPAPPKLSLISARHAASASRATPPIRRAAARPPPRPPAPRVTPPTTPPPPRGPYPAPGPRPRGPPWPKPRAAAATGALLEARTSEMPDEQAYAEFQLWAAAAYGLPPSTSRSTPPAAAPAKAWRVLQAALLILSGVFPASRRPCSSIVQAFRPDPSPSHAGAGRTARTDHQPGRHSRARLAAPEGRRHRAEGSTRRDTGAATWPVRRRRRARRPGRAVPAAGQHPASAAARRTRAATQAAPDPGPGARCQQGTAFAARRRKPADGARRRGRPCSAPA